MFAILGQEAYSLFFPHKCLNWKTMICKPKKTRWHWVIVAWGQEKCQAWSGKFGNAIVWWKKEIKSKKKKIEEDVLEIRSTHTHFSQRKEKIIVKNVISKILFITLVFLLMLHIHCRLHYYLLTTTNRLLTVLTEQQPLPTNSLNYSITHPFNSMFLMTLHLTFFLSP